MAIEARPVNNCFPSLLPYGNRKEILNSDFGGTAGVFLPAMDDGGVHLPLPRKRPRDAAALSFLGEDFSLQMIQQQLEVDRSIFLHTENFRIEIEERMRNQWRRWVVGIEQKMAKVLVEKEEQIQKIEKVNAALQERVKSLYLENQLWRDLAQSNEATANVLRSNLEHLLVQINTKACEELSGEVVSDAESCCGSSGNVAVDDVVGFDGEEILRWRKVPRTGGGVEGGKRMCRVCGDVESSVLVLPCRHLCLCAACAPVVDVCPICNSVKNATVHVNFS